MSFILVLCSEMVDNGQDLILSEQYSDYDGKNIIDVVYQDAAYSYELISSKNGTIFKNADIYINNEKIDTSWHYDEDGEKYIFTPGYNYKFPFQLHYGLIQISLMIEDLEGIKYYFSPYLAVGIKERYLSSEKSINKMLDYIYKKEHELLYRGKPHNESVLPQYIRNSNNIFTQEIELLKTIKLNLTKQQLCFVNGANQRIVSNYIVDRFEKIQSIKSENIRFIAIHPEEMQRSYTTHAIVVNGVGYEPTRTLIEEKTKSRDTYENRSVLSFIRTLSLHVENRITEIKQILDDNTSDLKIMRTLKPEYILSYLIIRRYIETTFKDHLKSLLEIKKQLGIEYAAYRRVLLCESSPLHTIPRPTPIFLEVRHYRVIYEMMYTWFGYSKNTMPINYLQFHFTSADRIYEYYCLICLFDLIVDLGYRAEENGIFKYLYNPPCGMYHQTEEDNTFRFKKENKELVLYYQPVIYSRQSRTTNEIDLFRTDRSYYIPDFIIKITEYAGNDGDVQKITYGIIDAKWRNRTMLANNVDQGSLHDLIMKYYFSIRRKDNTQSVDFLWLLQGKDDSLRTDAHFYHCGNISQTQVDRFKYSTAIIQLTPDFGNQDVVDALKVYLQIPSDFERVRDRFIELDKIMNSYN